MVLKKVAALLTVVMLSGLLSFANASCTKAKCEPVVKFFTWGSGCYQWVQAGQGSSNASFLFGPAGTGSFIGTHVNQVHFQLRQAVGCQKLCLNSTAFSVAAVNGVGTGNAFGGHPRYTCDCHLSEEAPACSSGS